MIFVAKLPFWSLFFLNPLLERGSRSTGNEGHVRKKSDEKGGKQVQSLRRVVFIGTQFSSFIHLCPSLVLSSNERGRRFLANISNGVSVISKRYHTRPVFQFKEKFDALFGDLESTKPDWDIVFLGTCLNLHGTASLDPRRESRDLLYAERNNGTRCFNAVMMK